jgi:hypothetical protein
MSSTFLIAQSSGHARVLDDFYVKSVDCAQALIGMPLDRFSALVAAALLTGCCYGELAVMIVDDFNSDAGTLRVRISKGGKPRHVVLTQEGRDFAAGLAAGKPGSARLLARSNGRPWGSSEQQRLLFAACTAAGSIPRQTFMGYVTPTPAGSP